MAKTKKEEEKPGAEPEAKPETKPGTKSRKRSRKKKGFNFSKFWQGTVEILIRSSIIVSNL